jgi:hypothetical protein
MESQYTTNSKAAIDRSKFGLVFTKTRVLARSATNGKFKILPVNANYRPDAERELGASVRLATLHPPLHGWTDFEYYIVNPGGAPETILRVAHDDSHWRLWYTAPITVPKGARMECTVHYGN